MQWQVSLENISGFLTERGFFERVMGNRDHFKAQWPRVLQAMLSNALDAKRSDQFEWMKRFRDEVNTPPSPIQPQPKQPPSDGVGSLD